MIQPPRRVGRGCRARRPGREVDREGHDDPESAEKTGQGAEKVLEVIHEEERIAQRKRVEGLKLGGLITTMVGVGLGILFYTVEVEAIAVAAIPLLIGLALLAYAVFLAPKPE
jgi:hypothetical protein